MRGLIFLTNVNKGLFFNLREGSLEIDETFVSVKDKVAFLHMIKYYAVNFVLRKDICKAHGNYKNSKFSQ